MKIGKRALAILLTFLMILTFIPICRANAESYITSVSNAVGSDYTSNSKLADVLNSIFKGDIDIYSNSSYTTEVFMPVGSSMSTSTQYYIKSKTTGNQCTGWQCYIYANAVYNQLFKEWVGHGNSFSHSKKVISGGSNTASYSMFKSAGVKCGAYMRTTTNSSGAYNGSAGHSMIILSYNTSTISYLEGNANGEGLIRITTQTWSEFNKGELSGRSRYIAHVVQPTDSKYDELYPAHTHTYSNACDTTCNVCGATRSVSHTYSSSCDEYCNICSYKRTTSATHSWSNRYCGNGTCTACGIGRVTFHNYSDATCTKPKTCTICGLTSGSALGHSYSNSCDDTCNICGAERAINHTYSNDCDSSCNICGFSRTPSWHVYTNACDSTCNECGIRRIVSNHNYDDCFEGYEQQSYGSWDIIVTKTGLYTIEPNRTVTDYTYHGVEIYDKNNNKVLYNEKKQGWPLIEGEKYTISLKYFALTYYDLGWNLIKNTSTIFPDTSASGWYNDAVTYAVGAGLITGYGGTDKFGTADNIQRQDFVVILARLAGVDLDNYVSSGNYSFADVPSGAYYEKAIMWAADVGITTGYAGGTVFGVGDKVTREQLVTFLYRYAKYINGGVAPTVSADAEQKAKTYADYNGVTGYAKEAIIWAIDKGVIKGQGGTHIAPAGNALRCEIAQIMYNIYLNDIFK